MSRWVERESRDWGKEDEEERVVRGSRRSAVMVMRRAKEEGVVRKVWKVVWRVGEAVMPDCIFGLGAAVT